MSEPTRLPKTLRRRAADDRSRPPCNDCGGTYAQHNALWRMCFCTPDCDCFQYVGGAVAK